MQDSNELPLLHQIARRFSEMDSRFQTTLVSFYTIDSAQLEAFHKLVSNLSYRAHPCGMGVCQVPEHDLAHVDQFLMGGSAGPNVQAFLGKRRIPAGDYLFIASPCIVDGSSSNEGIARDRMAMDLGLVVATLGRAAAQMWAFDLYIAATTGNQSCTGNPIRAPQPADCAKLVNGKIMSDGLSAMQSASPNLRNEMMYAWTLLGRAVREEDETFRFILHWIALEVMANTHGDGVAAKVANAYGKPKSFALNDLECRTIIDLRNRLVHKGESVLLDARTERLLQGLFIDVWRARLKLDCAGVTMAMLRCIPLPASNNR